MVRRWYEQNSIKTTLAHSFMSPRRFLVNLCETINFACACKIKPHQVTFTRKTKSGSEYLYIYNENEDEFNLEKY